METWEPVPPGVGKAARKKLEERDPDLHKLLVLATGSLLGQWEPVAGQCKPAYFCDYKTAQIRPVSVTLAGPCVQIRTSDGRVPAPSATCGRRVATCTETGQDWGLELGAQESSQLVPSR